MSKSSARYICGCGYYSNDWEEFSSHKCKETRNESRIKKVLMADGTFKTKAKALWELI